MKHTARILSMILMGIFLLSLAVYAADGKGTVLSRPDETRAVLLLPGQDFRPEASEGEFLDQIERALDQAESWNLNAVFVPVNGPQGALFQGEEWPEETSFDALDCVLDAAAARGLYVYPILDAGYGIREDGSYGELGSLSAEKIRSFCRAAGELVSRYTLDGVYLDGYCNRKDAASMTAYRREGSAMGFENWVRECTTALTVNVSKIVRAKLPAAVFGLVTEPVWANRTTVREGSPTAAEYEMLTDGFMDPVNIFALGQIDDLLVRCPGSLFDPAVGFETVLGWWGKFVSERGSTVTALLYNQKLGSRENDWQAPDQVLRQVIAAGVISGCRGTAFGSLPALADNYQGSTDVLKDYYGRHIREKDLLTELTVSAPSRQNFTTQEPQTAFYGVSDPNFPLLLNGEPVERDDSGVFSLEMPLEPGDNCFILEHKNQSVTYHITHREQIIRSISPYSPVLAQGGQGIVITAEAYSGAEVTAELDGVRVALLEEEPVGSSGSAYALFRGSIILPQAHTAEQLEGSIMMPGESQKTQSIGRITVTAGWKGKTQSVEGAPVNLSVTHEKPPRAEGQKGMLVLVDEEQAPTYPADLLSSEPSGQCFPLPSGTEDFIIGEELTCDDGHDREKYYILANGMRIRSRDVLLLGEAEWEQSQLAAASGWTEDQYLYVAFDRSGRKTAYSVEFPGVTYTQRGEVQQFAPEEMQLLLHDTRLNAVPPELEENSLFSQIELTQYGKDTMVRFHLKKAGSFLGFRAWYENDRLIFRFNLIPTGLRGAKITLDPGHGGADPGISIPGLYTEKEINARIAARAAELLREQGAVVQVIRTEGTVPMENRLRYTRNFGPQFFVSIHQNAGASAERGTEAYYFSPYSRLTARYLSGDVSEALRTRNRGGRYGNCGLTAQMEFAAVHLECGFLTNPDELAKLRGETYQEAAAQAIVDGIAATIAAMQ